MAQKEKNKGKKIGLIVAGVFLFVWVGVGVYFLLKNMTESGNVESSTTSESTEITKTANTTSAEKVSEAVTKITDSEVVKEDGIEVIDENDPNNSTVVTGAISYSGFKGDKYRITVAFEQALSEGECSLSLDGTKMATGEVVAHPNSSSCAFDLSEVSEGEFEAEIFVTTTGGREGVIVGRIEVEK